MTVYAIVKDLDCGYQYDRDRAEKAGLKIGDRYKLQGVSMGQSHTTVTLEDLGAGFNSIFFEYEENGEPLNIYNDARFNPYIKSYF